MIRRLLQPFFLFGCASICARLIEAWMRSEPIGGFGTVSAVSAVVVAAILSWDSGIWEEGS